MKQPRTSTGRAPATAPMVDGCIRENIRFRLGPPNLVPLFSHSPLMGPAVAVKHAGSVDVFLEAFEEAKAGSILVIDNEARDDEGCIGDLTCIEAQHVGVQAAVIWGRHRDSAELRTLGFPVLSLGSCPAGPNRTTVTRGSMGKALLGAATVRTGDMVFLDADGVVFVDAKDASNAIEAARDIMDRERKQAQAVKKGTTLREQFRFREYLRQREQDPSYTLRAHLRRLRAEIEV